MAERASKKVTLARDEKILDNRFNTNNMVAASLVAYIPANDRVTVMKWLAKLQVLNCSKEDRTIRDDYMWFLLIQLENGIISVPFLKNPPPKLRPLQKMIPQKAYEDILLAANNKSKYQDDRAEYFMDVEENPEAAAIRMAQEKSKCKRFKPSDFHKNQPEPKCGFVVYGSCFSNQNH